MLRVRTCGLRTKLRQLKLKINRIIIKPKKTFVVTRGRVLEVSRGGVVEELGKGHLLIADVLHGVVEGVHLL